MATVTYIIGDGGHAHDIADDLRTPYRDPGPIHFVPNHKDYGLYIHRPDDRFIIGINDLHTRIQVAADIGNYGMNEGRWSHTYIQRGPGVTIGAGTHVNYMSSMTRTAIGEFCTISPGVTICGDVTIGDRVFIGAGSTIKNLVTIGSDAFIPMGSVVVRDVAPGERYKR